MKLSLKYLAIIVLTYCFSSVSFANINDNDFDDPIIIEHVAIPALVRLTSYTECSKIPYAINAEFTKVSEYKPKLETDLKAVVHMVKDGIKTEIPEASLVVENNFSDIAKAGLVCEHTTKGIMSLLVTGYAKDKDLGDTITIVINFSEDGMTSYEFADYD